LQAEALSQIATLTGGRKDGFDTHLDLEKALSKLPENQHDVFAAIYLENGELLNRPRTYDEATFLTGLTLQELRTLERRATEALRPVLAPSFFKRRTGPACCRNAWRRVRKYRPVLRGTTEVSRCNSV
jgi:hypothetical protein